MKPNLLEDVPQKRTNLVLAHHWREWLYEEARRRTKVVGHPVYPRAIVEEGLEMLKNASLPLNRSIRLRKVADR